MSSPTASTRTLVIALLANLGIAVAKFVAAAITGLVGDADGRRAQRRRFHQPAAADVGAAARRSGRPTCSTPSDTGASSISGASSSPSSCSRSAPACRSTKASSTSCIRSIRSRRGSRTLCFLSPSCSKAGRRSKRSRNSGRPRAGLGWFEAIRRSKDPPSFIVLLENGAAMAGHRRGGGRPVPRRS